ncbi:MAG: PilZ domain-containing protein [Sphingomonadaceae bacterium]|nr:PilZ domain-containing protein [Sphingomonadaceae bacterium]
MGVENFPNAAADSKRSAKRARVLLTAKLKTPFGEVDARLRDLSRKGALVECAQVPPVGTEVVFIRGSTVVPARVAWAGADRLGLEFHYMIDEQEVLVHIARRPQPKPESFRRPGLREVLSEDQRKVARAWGVAVGINFPEGKF